MDPSDDPDDFPSGPWRGYYVYGPGGVRHRQEMALRFENGSMSGEGTDGVGPFLIRGHYDASSRTVSWVKTYVGAHSVSYQGFREGKGIWGTWQIGPLAHGGFRIWPRGSSTGEEDSQETVEQEPTHIAALTQACASRRTEP